MKRSLGLVLTTCTALFLGACGSSSTSGDSTPAESTLAPTGEAVDLSSVCPATVVVQTDWNPESDHGFLYEMIGPGYRIDTEKLRVTGDLVANGQKTGVRIEVRAGGRAINWSQVTAEMYTDPTILLGFVNTDESLSHSVDFPTKAVFAPFEVNPQIIMWDPAVHPDVKSISDLKDKDVKVRYRDGVSFMEYFLANNILSRSQVDGTYDGTGAAYVASGGSDAQQGYGTMEPYYYENILVDWRKPVAYQYIHEAGWTSYAQSMSVTPSALEQHAACLKKLVPVMQRALADFMKSPDRANAIIVDAVATYNVDWMYNAEQAVAAVEKMRADSLVANGPDGTLGSFDMQRVEDFIAKATPVYTAGGTKVKRDLKASDLVTNEFIDPAISL